jgi:hypothetical protein
MLAAEEGPRHRQMCMYKENPLAAIAFSHELLPSMRSSLILLAKPS